MQIVTKRGVLFTAVLALALCACDDLSKRLQEDHEFSAQTTASPSPSASPSESPDATETPTPTETPTATPTSADLFGFRNQRVGASDVASLNSVLNNLTQAGAASGTGKAASSWLGQQYKKTTPGSSQDSDGDGFIDQLEEAYSTDIEDRSSFPIGITTTSLANRLRSVDEDGDGLLNTDELQRATSVQNPDSDADGVLDGLEVLASTNPLDANSKPRDVDEDGLSDDYESKNGSNPTNIDTDGDDLSDGFEVALKTNPLDDDTDHDGILDGKEVMLGSDPTIYEGRLDLSQ